MTELAKSNEYAARSREKLDAPLETRILNSDGWLAAFFFIVAFSWPLQIIVASPLAGLISYLPLLAVAAIGIKNTRALLKNFSSIDAAFLLSVFLVVAHAVFNLLISKGEPSFHLKWLLVFSSSAFVYLHVAKSASLRSLRFSLIAVILAASILGLHWLYESYAKTVLRELSWYAIESIKYVLERNNYSMDQLNSSIASVEYRAYGLLDKHTTTAAYVAVGVFAALSLSFTKKLLFKVAIFTAGLIVLFIGLGTTALLSYMVLAPVLMFLTAKPKQRIISFVSPIVMMAVAFLIINALSSTNTGIGKLLDHRWITFRIQLHTLTNFREAPMDTKYGEIKTSFPKVYKKESSGFARYITFNPTKALLGEGVGTNSPDEFQRGGDLGLMEIFATFGVPMSIAIAIASLALIGFAIRDILRAPSHLFEHELLVFGLITVTFLVMTLGHYNTVFKKEILPLLMLSLGILRRFSSQPNLFGMRGTNR